MSEVSKIESDAKQAMEEARLKVVESEKEIQKIKAQLLNIQQSYDNKSNKLKLSVSNVSQTQKSYPKLTYFCAGERSNRR